MPKLYASIGITILLFAALCGAQWWFNGKIETAYNEGKAAGESAEKAKWQQIILDSQAKAEIEKQRLENILKLERKSWENRLNALKNMHTDCMPPDVLGLLRDSGIYTGPIPCK